MTASAKVRAIREDAEDAARMAACPVCDREGCRDQGRKSHGLAKRRDLWQHRSVEVASGKRWTIELRADGDKPWQVTVYAGLVLDLDHEGLRLLAEGLGQAKRRLAKANRLGAEAVA